MSEILEDIKKSKGLDLVNMTPSEKEDFESTVLNHQIKLTKERVKGYLSSVEEIKNGKDLTTLNDFEAAKIISLGTVVGKR